LLWKIIYRKLLPIFLQNILYKTSFATNFVGNTCEFYNFVANNYLRRNYLQIKILRKISRKKSFLANFFNKFARKFACNMRIFSSVQLLIFIKIILWKQKLFYNNYNKIIKTRTKNYKYQHKKLKLKKKSKVWPYISHIL